MNISKILATYDFSETSNRALAFAATLAQQTGAQLDLVYVLADLYDGRADPSLLPATYPGEMERYLRFLQEELHRMVKVVIPEFAGKVTCHALRGDPVKHIETLAAELSASVVAVGATGKGAVARIMLGSVAQNLLRSSTIPVLVVP